jgi:hypothetical protein
MVSRFIFVPFVGLLLSMTPAGAEDNNSLPPDNRLVLEAVSSMPLNGGYAPSAAANHALRQAVTSSDGILRVDASHATPSYCSSATYLVFLKTLAALQSAHQIALAPAVIAQLKPIGQPDGTGIWGRWNANGPGTARLFYELGLGRNFTDLRLAREGDFLKIFWSNGIGASEHGHSVIFLGTEMKAGVEHVRFWSSNIPNGYGIKSVPLSRIHRMLFSRLEHPEAIIHSLPRTDNFLSSMERRSSTAAEMERQCGIR